jgi:hypothetical protein
MRRASKTRVSTWSYAGKFDEPAVEKLLARARELGFVTEYDTGRGYFVWFSGRGGRPMRQLRRQIMALRQPEVAFCSFQDMKNIKAALGQ